MTEKQIKILGIVASIMAVGMHKGNPVQPFVAFVNCTLWTGYGLFKKPRDWPIVVANVPGIFLGLAACFTAL